VKQAGAGGVRKELKDRSERLRFVTTYDLAQQRRDVLGVEALDLAAVRRQFHICTIVHIIRLVPSEKAGSRRTDTLSQL
jgi:hypothetical protein